MPYSHAGSHMMRIQMLRSKKKIQQARKSKSKRSMHTSQRHLYEEPPGDRYHGHTNHLGEYHGVGTLYTYYYTYSGNWCNHKRHGRGIEQYHSGDIYNCTWVNDTIHGIGEIKKKGKTYFGFFYLKPNDTSIYKLRRSRRIAQFPPEYNGLVYKQKTLHKKIIKEKTYNENNPTIYSYIILLTFFILVNYISHTLL